MKKKSYLFLGIKKMLYWFYPKTEIVGESFPEEPCILVGNHAQIHGPLICELYFPDDKIAWCAGQMMHWKEVPDYAFQDFWSQKPKWTHFFYRVLSYLITPLSVLLFRNARTVPVYRDHRIMKTFKESVRILDEGKSLVIFPEYDQKKNHIIYEFQSKFIDVARIYHKKTGKEISFVPFYNAPSLKKVCIGKPIPYQHQNEKEEEREKLCQKLMEEITKLGESMPKHRVVPYRNISKKYYPYSRA